jgi:glycosyltransferase involved in cell wall biosynthesis
MQPLLSIIICTFNPYKSIFEKCLKDIYQAWKLMENVEIILVDNNSTNNFINEEYVKKFIIETNANVLVEYKQGLTPARLKGIEGSKGDIVLFIDDDNFIPNNFLSEGIGIANDFPHIGAWSGQVNLLFEEQPEKWTEKYWGLLVYRKLNRDVWSNNPHLEETMPCGAGLFVRRNVALYYLDLHNQGKRNIQLDRKGNSLFSGGDNDLAACACDLEMGVGLFTNLTLDHFIPSSRTNLPYLLKLAEGIAASTIVFRSFRGELTLNPNFKKVLANIIRGLLKSKIERAFFNAVMSGEKIGRRMLDNSKF